MSKKLAPKRNLEQTRGRILQVAFGEVYTRGFQGVSVDDIVKKTSLTKGAFYHHFPTKLDLGYALVEEVIQPMIAERWIRPLAAYKNPLHGIYRLLKKHIGEAEDLRYGCPLNNLVQEMAPVDEGFGKRLEAALLYWIDETEKHLKRGQAEKKIRADVDVREAAEFIVMAHEGFFGLMKGLPRANLFESLLAPLKRYFEAISL